MADQRSEVLKALMQLGMYGPAGGAAATAVESPGLVKQVAKTAWDTAKEIMPLFGGEGGISYPLENAPHIYSLAANLPPKLRHVAQKILDAMAKLEPLSVSSGSVVSIRDLRNETKLPPKQFDDAMMELSRSGSIALHYHDFPSSLSPEVRNQLLRQSVPPENRAFYEKLYNGDQWSVEEAMRDKYYIGAAIRPEVLPLRVGKK